MVYQADLWLQRLRLNNRLDYFSNYRSFSNQGGYKIIKKYVTLVGSWRKQQSSYHFFSGFCCLLVLDHCFSFWLEDLLVIPVQMDSSCSEGARKLVGVARWHEVSILALDDVMFDAVRSFQIFIGRNNDVFLFFAYFIT